jgi:hypothetical protein
MTGSFRGVLFVLWQLWPEHPAGVEIEHKGEIRVRVKFLVHS